MKRTPQSFILVVMVLRQGELALLNPDGSTKITLTTKVTGKGQVYFINKFFIVEGRKKEK